MPVPKNNLEKHAGGRPPMFATPAEMQVEIDKYFKDCEEKQRPLTMSGLALAIGFLSRRSLIDYNNKNEFMPAIQKARQKVQSYAEEQLFIGKNQVGTIFALKNNFGWEDKREVNTNIMVNSAEIINSARNRAIESDPAIDVECIPCEDKEENND